jgi:short subunit dehydrogenase-like uncharacterized protein
MTQDRSFDIVLFGATGFTGGLVAQHLAATARKQPLRWAVAGRSRDKLTAVVRGLGAGAEQVGVLMADSADAASLAALARQAKVVITTVGPYALYGEPLVKACAEAGTHYVDLTGEPAFVDRMIDRYHGLAASRGAKIVNACGFDSIPHDFGAFYTVRALAERLGDAAMATATVRVEGFVRAGGSFSGGTWHSAVTAMGNARADARERRNRVRAPHPAGGRRVHGMPPSLRFRKELGVWALPMPTIDPQVVLRSARTLPAYGADFAYGHYMGLKHVYQAVGLTAGVGAVFALAQLPITRARLLALRAPGEGPDAATRVKGWFCVNFQGRAAGQSVTTEVRGGDPGYGDTAKMLAESALCLAFDDASLPKTAGVLTSVEALGDALFPRLEANGIHFRVR